MQTDAGLPSVFFMSWTLNSDSKSRCYNHTNSIRTCFILLQDQTNKRHEKLRERKNVHNNLQV